MAVAGREKVEESKEKLLGELSSDFQTLKSIHETKEEIYGKMSKLAEKLNRLENKEIEEMKKDDEFTHDEIIRECQEMIQEIREESEALFQKTREELDIIDKLSNAEKGLEKIEQELSKKRNKLNG